MSSQPVKPKVKIQYGIFGGERLGRRLRRALKDDGFAITRTAAEADIILAHSAGCFWLPAAPTHQKLVLIDPPYWPERSISERGKARITSNFKFRQHNYRFHRWIRRNIWGGYYAVRDLKRTRRIVKHAPDYDLNKIIKNHTVLLIRNEHDDWLTPELDHLQQEHPALLVRQLPGDHEDWYHNPKPYIDLIQSVYEIGK